MSLIWGLISTENTRLGRVGGKQAPRTSYHMKLTPWKAGSQRMATERGEENGQ